jgi:hypothetical protein
MGADPKVPALNIAYVSIRFLKAEGVIQVFTCFIGTNTDADVSKLSRLRLQNVCLRMLENVC